MKKRHWQILTATALVIATLSIFNNCGSSKTGGSSTQASRSVPTDTEISSSNSWLSNCNLIGTNTMNLEGPVSTYYNQATASYVADLIRLKFNKFPLELINTDNHYLQIFRWHENSLGNPVYNSTPVDIYFIQKNTGVQVQQDPVRELSKGTIQKLIQENNLNITPDRFFESVIMVLDGMDIEWDAMTIALYDTAGGEAIDHVDILLPAFDADPNLYASDHHSQSLRNLHPWWGVKDDNYTEGEFYNFSKELCAGF